MKAVAASCLAALVAGCATTGGHFSAAEPLKETVPAKPKIHKEAAPKVVARSLEHPHTAVSTTMTEVKKDESRLDNLDNSTIGAVYLDPNRPIVAPDQPVAYPMYGYIGSGVGYSGTVPHST
jgi:hypothetical protein